MKTSGDHPADARRSMIRVPGGTFLMGSEQFYPEERPVRRVSVDGFWMDPHPVTNAAFRRFIEATGYVTIAERAPNTADYPDIDPAQLVAGSLVFRRPPHRVSLRDFRVWWSYVPGACWYRPEGESSSIAGREEHPVVHIAYEDALEYAAWARKALPTEAEWEYAARGGLENADYVWGNDSAPGGRVMANTWQGEFPWQNLLTDGYEGTSPVGKFPANGYGLCDMAGNVWEWTSDLFTPGREKTSKACCVPTTSQGTVLEYHGDVESTPILRRVVKGGSHLCAPNHCLRYRPAARQGEAVDTSACHIGFRCIVRSTESLDETS